MTDIERARWRFRVRTAHRYGWYAGKNAARDVVATGSPELAELVAWAPYEEGEELQHLLQVDAAAGSEEELVARVNLLDLELQEHSASLDRISESLTALAAEMGPMAPSKDSL